MLSFNKSTKLHWLQNRLRCMSREEICHRFVQLGTKQLMKYGALKLTATKRVHVTQLRVAMLPVPDNIEASSYLKEADEILNGNVPLFADRRFSVGMSPEWNRDPLSGILAPAGFGLNIDVTDRALVGDIKHIWELNRHLHLVRLAQAYVLSKDKHYLDGLARQLNSWMEQCPAACGPNWSSSLELGIRLINWSLIWSILGGWESELFDGLAGERLRERWLSSIFAHCKYINSYFSRYSSANNHLIGELAGLYIASRTWPCWKETTGWANKAKAGLEREIVLQHSEDGVNREQAFSYQVFTAEFLLIAGIYGERLEDAFSNEYWRRIEASLHFLCSVRNISGHMPMIGDADDGMVCRLVPGAIYDRCAMVLGLQKAIFTRQPFTSIPDAARWLLGSPEEMPLQKKGNKPENDWNFPCGGYFIFGSEFGQQNEVKGIVDCGPLGYLGIAAHGHADALALTLSVCGEECLVDAGTYSYWQALKWRDYFRGTSAHNTVRVDGQDQSISGGRFMWTQKAIARIERFPLSPGKFEFVGSHDGYMRFADPVRHVRSVQYDDMAMTLVVRDDIVGNQLHEIEQFWHFGPTIQLELEQNSALIKGQRFHIQAVFMGAGLQLTSHRGCEEPPLGWLSTAYESKEPSHVLRVRTTAACTSIAVRFKITILETSDKKLGRQNFFAKGQRQVTGTLR